MHVVCVGLNHRTAPLELREQHCRNAGELAATLEHFAQAAAGRPTDLRELVILSTCNRLEYYAATDPALANGGADLAAEVRRYFVDGHGGEPGALHGWRKPWYALALIGATVLAIAARRHIGRPVRLGATPPLLLLISGAAVIAFDSTAGP